MNVNPYEQKQIEIFDEELISLDDSVDDRIIKESNEQLGKLAAELEVAKEALQYLAELLPDQANKLEVAEESATHTAEDIAESVEELQEAIVAKKKNMSLKVLVITGAVSGGVIGTAGFALGPAIGVSAMLLSTGIGASLGGLAGQ